MKRAILYNLLLGLMYGGAIIFFIIYEPPAELMRIKTPILCCLFGGIGGATYCLRGVYMSACVKRNWDKGWLPWYFIRPLVSFVFGGISWVFFRAGLLVFESQQEVSASQFAILSLAFIAGLNVDKFVIKIEDIAATVWGIEKSRVSQGADSRAEEVND